MFPMIRSRNVPTCSLVIIFLIVSIISSTTSLCGHSHSFDAQKNRRTSYIVGGFDALEGDYPWMVSIGNTKHPHFCGGSLINERWVITAAHCHPSMHDKLKPFLRFGSTDQLSNDMQKQHVRESSTVKHPLYKNSPGSGDDIMLIKLPKPVVFSKTIEPICLPRQGQYFAGKATVAGWGMDGKGALPMKLQHVDVKLLNASICKNDIKYQMPKHGHGDKKVCAGYEEGLLDSCLADSGGPLFTKIGDQAVQVGLVSYGYKCAVPGYPGVYTRVSSFIEWIEKTIQSKVNHFN